MRQDGSLTSMSPHDLNRQLGRRRAHLPHVLHLPKLLAWRPTQGTNETELAGQRPAVSRDSVLSLRHWGYLASGRTRTSLGRSETWPSLK